MTLKGTPYFPPSTGPDTVGDGDVDPTRRSGHRGRGGRRFVSESVLQPAAKTSTATSATAARMGNAASHVISPCD